MMFIFWNYLILEKNLNNDILRGMIININYMEQFSYREVFFGHYITYINIRLKDLWYEFNDSSVIMIGHELPLDNANILFYINAYLF